MEIVHTGDLGAFDAQYQAIKFQEWKTKDDCQAEQFWAEVLNCKDSSGEQCFNDNDNDFYLSHTRLYIESI